MAKYVCALIAVVDVGRSRAFYEGLLGQKVLMDLGVNVSFEGSFAIHERTHFANLLEAGTNAAAAGPAAVGAEAGPIKTGELYFEEEDLPSMELRLRDAGVAFVHPIHEQPWAQRVFRCLDPDGHIVEIGEPMETVVRGLVQGGMTVAEAAERTGMSIDFVTRNVS